MKTFAIKNLLLSLLVVFITTGCHWDMWDQARYEPLEGGDFFGEGEGSSRTLVAGVVPYQSARLDTQYYQGKHADGTFIPGLPSRITQSDEFTEPDGFKHFLEHGRDRFEIFCTPCHGYQGLGDGMVVQRGFPNPPSYIDQRLLEVEPAYFFDVMSNGFGRMYSYASRIPVNDRWAIAAYVRTLQLSQNAIPDLLTEEILEDAMNPPAVVEDAHGEPSGDHAEQEEEGNSEH